jgi:hypothetical protein
MAGKNVQGLAESYSLFERLPSAAHEEMAVELAIIARELLVAQEQDVARATGELAGALGFQLLLNRLKVKVGLLLGGRAAGKFNGRQRKELAGGPFYGRFVEFGRRAQTVLVTRRLKRKVKGNGRNGNGRRVIYQGKPYTLRVKAQAPRPFVTQPLLQQVADNHLSEFWAGAIARTGSA